MATLRELSDRYTQATVDGTLPLTAENCGVPALAAVLDRLPARRVLLPGPQLVLDTNSLTVTATPSELWPIGTGSARAVTVTWLELVLTAESAADPTVALRLKGFVTVGAAAVNVAGGLDESGRLSLTRVAEPAKIVSLSDLVDFVGDSQWGVVLPAGTGIFAAVPLADLRVVLAVTPTQDTEVVAGATLAEHGWTLIDDFVTFSGIGVEVKATTSTRVPNVEMFSGAVYGTAELGDFPVTARLTLRDDGAGEVELVPAAGDARPGIVDLARLVGDDALAGEVQAGFDMLNLSALALDRVTVAFDLTTRAIRNVVVDTHITVDGVSFAVGVVLPTFAIYGHLMPGRTVDLRTLVGKSLPETAAQAFPTMELSQLRIAAIPNIGRYEFVATLDSDLSIHIGPVPLAFTSCTLSIARDPAGVAGSIEGYVSVFDADFRVFAEHDPRGGGWQFTCESLAGSALTVRAVHDRLVELYNVDSTLPGALASLELDRLRIFADTASRAAKFDCVTSLRVGDQLVDTTVTIQIDPVAGGWRKSFTGRVTVADLDFELHVMTDPAETVMAATYYHTGDSRQISVRDLVLALSEEAGELIPDDLSIDLRDVVLGVVGAGEEAGAAFVLGLELGAKLGLSSLPLVGQLFPADRSLGVDSLRIVAASRDLTTVETDAINALLPAAVPPLPVATAGVTATARLNLGDTAPKELALPVAAAPAATSTPSTAPAPAVSTVDTTRWFDVQKTFGPVYVGRIGFEYADKKVLFRLDASLTVAALTLSLDGLTFGSPIDRFEPTFDLRGIGVDYRSGAVEIGGALLRTTIKPAGGEPYDEYDGAALIRTADFALAALGGYVYLNGQASMFVYAVLDKALGGPPFFTVTGLAAGFGYNRRLLMPSIDQVATFPLITAATNPQPATGAAQPRDLLRTQLDGLRTWIPPTAGDMFLAIGVRFSSFQMVDSFALLVLGLGERFELDLLGLSTMVAPRPDLTERQVAPLVELQLAIRASFVPAEGLLFVRGQLTSASYLFSRDGQLTGGFAFYDWFGGEHDGDFVLTIGGYHPAFPVPAHYPQVPRLALNWQVDANLGIKADAYLALTPSALMAGGHLQVIWQSGALRAAFSVGIDFLIAWKPYHYDAHAYIDLNVSYTFVFFGTHQITVDIGADLHIWGPDFAGTAHINLWIISFDIAFGAQDRPAPQPVEWAVFRRSFLPSGALCGVTAAAGLVSRTTGTAADLGVLDPQRLVLRVDTVIPSNAARIRGDLAVTELYAGADGTPTPFVTGDARAVPAQQTSPHRRPLGGIAVGPMRLVPPGHNGVHLRSALTVEVTRDGGGVEHHFGFTPLLRNLPTALWGELGASMVPDPTGEALVRDLLGGFELRPRLDPMEGDDRAAVGGMELRQYHLPTLPVGTYHVTVTQDVTTDEPTPAARRIPPERFTTTVSFTIAGNRPQLDPGEIYALYPPENSAGHYRADLPHIVLNHSTLPWQDTADPSRDDLPWLALLLFDETDAPEPQLDDDKLTVIDVPASLLPSQNAARRDLALLTHVRRDADGVERAVVIANRLPRPDSTHVAHLVSVRHLYGAAGVTATGTVRVVSLKSWRFTDIEAGGDLKVLLRHLADGAAALGAPVALPYVSGTGERADARYQGPLVPVADARRPALPAHAADELVAGADRGFAAAWQLGRLLALSSKPFAAALYRWKRRRAQQLRTGADGTPPPVPAAVAAWLDELALLNGVPYNYLVPDAGAAPAESLRFFTVHEGWIAALLDGALSLGRITPGDVDLDRTLASEIATAVVVDQADVPRPAVAPWTAHVLVPSAGTMSGFLIRSHVVGGWPDLRITAKAVKPARTVLLAPDTLLCLFAGDIRGVTITQPIHTVHFATADTDARDSQRVLDVTAAATARIGAEGAAAGHSASFAAATLATPTAVDIPRR
ncbi:DUF6603 domain-containing protein [Phytohabitans rumicis]|uniref:DUF6603 domain-containing protein n=1 Tax=Phytohabitans rumicis TaxID=1076125 RepID=A0A6V8L079_9ACTN|nr:DUF6603 domain-containing protein [Phytohabitans rumicis]GFJ87466.1 hypothetical protein Prum_011080 [Phytohabitans rumicis]